MPEETSSNPVPVQTPIPQAQETISPTPPEAVITLAPTEVPIEPVAVSEPIPEPASGHLGGNDPIDPAPAESIPSTPTIETPVAEPAPTETLTPEPAEATQPAPTEPVIETPPAAQVETLTPTQIPEPVTQAPTPAPVAPTTPTPAQVVASVVVPITAQTFTKSIRELFTKAQLAIQNRKGKKIDRVMTLFAKQTMITNNEVEKLLHISDSTATRYLNTLTKEGKIKQNTKKGHTTSYSKI